MPLPSPKLSRGTCVLRTVFSPYSRVTSIIVQQLTFRRARHSSFILLVQPREAARHQKLGYERTLNDSFNYNVTVIPAHSTLNTNSYTRHPHKRPPDAALLYRPSPPQKAVPPHPSLPFYSPFRPFVFPLHHPMPQLQKPQSEGLATGRKGRGD